ncbi:MAG TPA: zinc-dependent metalloprotease family protein, partial [Blastocatellia bacterium]|nr:zinc-dependent metalloprotease family protein [Blastocatellia bacterium]
MKRALVRPHPMRDTKRRGYELFILCVILVSFFLLPAAPGRRASGYTGQPANARAAASQRQSGDGIWTAVDRNSLPARVETASPDAYQVVELNAEALSRVLANAPMEFSQEAAKNRPEVKLPMPDGSFAGFQIEESPSMEPDLAAQFPDVKSYRGQGVDDPTATTRFDWSPNGFNAIILSASETVFIAPRTAGDTQNCISFYKKDLHEGFQQPQCVVTEAMQASAGLKDGIAITASVGTALRTYRLAIATTVEYTNNATYGGSKASTLTKLNTIVNLINAIYEREVSIRFQLVASELSIIFDVEPDGLTNGNQSTMLGESTGVINAGIGSGSYDVGHSLGLAPAGSSGGIAGLGVVCGANKGRGASILGIALVTGNFAIDSGLVAHEWGHEFSAAHTFNSTSGNCGGGNRNASTAWEPGSGSTVMSYGGTCSPENLQSNSDTYFLGGTFDQIVSFSAAGGACSTSTSTGNNPPTVSAGPDFSVPMGTPFTLTATATDPDGDALTYSWEELDIGTASPPMTDDGSRPLFRSFIGAASPSRTFPKLSDILNNTSTIGETLPTTTRSMNFRVTARDNRAAGGGVNSDAMILNVTATSGPFVVTQPNTAVSWTGGTSQTVTWNVANTTAAPVNCANVKISLSTNGGTTFPIVIASSTPNDGSELIVVPNNATTTARVKVEAVGNVFFDVSNANFTIVAGTGGGGSDTIGLFRPAGNFFFLRNTNSQGPPDVAISFGAPGDLPIVGDWDGNGTVTIGLFRPSSSTFFLRNSNTQGPPDITLSFGDGPGGDLPIAGDWDGNGTWTIGVYRPSTSTFFIRNS